MSKKNRENKKATLVAENVAVSNATVDDLKMPDDNEATYSFKEIEKLNDEKAAKLAAAAELLGIKIGEGIDIEKVFGKVSKALRSKKAKAKTEKKVGRMECFCIPLRDGVTEKAEVIRLANELYEKETGIAADVKHNNYYYGFAVSAARIFGEKK
jgi:hypothetical protein